MADNSAVLRVLTPEPQPPTNLVVLDNTKPCDDTFVCGCVSCVLDRGRRIRRGVRPSQPIPFKRKAA